MKLDDALQAVVPTARALPGSASTDVSPDVWRREMERLQADTWFQGPLVLSGAGRLSAASPGSETSVSSGTSRTASPAARTNAHSPAAGAKARERAEPDPTASDRVAFNGRERSALQVADGGIAMPTAGKLNQALGASVQAEPTAAPSSLHAMSRLVLSPGLASTSVELDAPQPSERTAGKLPQSEESQAAVRVHVEGNAKAATVWLGVDASALAELPNLTQTIARWLTRQGYGTPTWICNGQTLPEPVPTHAAARHQQQPGEPVPHFVIEPSTGESA